MTQTRAKRRVRVAPVPREPAAGKLAYNVEETAWVLGVSVSTVWDLLDTGALRKVYVGRRVIVARTDCERFLDAGGVRTLSGAKEAGAG